MKGAEARLSTLNARSTRAALVLALAVSIAAVLPYAMAGALIVQIRAELAVGRSAFGAMVATFFLATALSSLLGTGRLVERLGAVQSCALAGLGSATGLLGLAVARNPWHVGLALALAGWANAMSHPAANMLLLQRMRAGRLGLGFGVKQAAVPAGVTLAGLSVPLIAVETSWRVVCLVGAAAIALLLMGFWRAGSRMVDQVSAAPSRLGTSSTRAGLVWLAIGAGCGSAAAGPLASFLVDAGVVNGLQPGTAGLVLAVASTSGLVTRVALGMATDRFPVLNPLSLVVAQLTLGSVAYLLLGSGSATVYVVGAVLGYVAGWGWPGLFHQGVVIANRGKPASATGVVLTGLTLGGGLGPIAFGAMVDARGYAAGWALSAALSLLGAAAIYRGRRVERAGLTIS